MSLGYDVYLSLVNGYTIPSTPPIDFDGKKEFENNAKTMNAILCGLIEAEFIKVIHCSTVKDIWDKLHNAYQGDEKVRKAKVQTHRVVFEGILMKNSENIATHFLHVDEVVNALRGIGENVEEKIVLQKILHSLPMRLDG